MGAPVLLPQGCAKLEHSYLAAATGSHHHTDALLLLLLALLLPNQLHVWVHMRLCPRLRQAGAHLPHGRHRVTISHRLALLLLLLALLLTLLLLLVPHQLHVRVHRCLGSRLCQARAQLPRSRNCRGVAPRRTTTPKLWAGPLLLLLLPLAKLLR
jgi:hypothetical protein